MRSTAHAVLAAPSGLSCIIRVSLRLLTVPFLWRKDSLSCFVAHVATSCVLFKHANKRHSLRVNRFEHWLEVLRPCRLEILLHQVLVLIIQLLVLLLIALDLTLQGLYLLVKLHHMELSHVAVFFEGLILFSKQSDCILKLLTVAIPVLELLDVLEA